MLDCIALCRRPTIRALYEFTGIGFQNSLAVAQRNASHPSIRWKHNDRKSLYGKKPRGPTKLYRRKSKWAIVPVILEEDGVSKVRWAKPPKFDRIIPKIRDQSTQIRHQITQEKARKIPVRQIASNAPLTNIDVPDSIRRKPGKKSLKLRRLEVLREALRENGAVAVRKVGIDAAPILDRRPVIQRRLDLQKQRLGRIRAAMKEKALVRKLRSKRQADTEGEDVGERDIPIEATKSARGVSHAAERLRAQKEKETARVFRYIGGDSKIPQVSPPETSQDRRTAELIHTRQQLLSTRQQFLSTRQQLLSTAPPPPEPSDADKSLSNSLRLIMRQVPQSVVVCTATLPPSGGGITATPQGMTLSSFTMLSLSPAPPLVTFNIKHPSATLAAIKASRQFNIHFLSPTASGVSIARTFAEGKHLQHSGNSGSNNGLGPFEGMCLEVSRRDVLLPPRLGVEGVREVLRCKVLGGGEGLVSVADGTRTLVVAKVLFVMPPRGEELDGKGGYLGYLDGAYRAVGAPIVG